MDDSSQSFKELSVPSLGTSAYFISKNCGSGSCRYLQKWQNLTKTIFNDNGHYETFQLDKVVQLRRIIENGAPKSKKRMEYLF